MPIRFSCTRFYSLTDELKSIIPTKEHCVSIAFNMRNRRIDVVDRGSRFSIKTQFHWAHLNRKCFFQYISLPSIIKLFGMVYTPQIDMFFFVRQLLNNDSGCFHRITQSNHVWIIQFIPIISFQQTLHQHAMKWFSESEVIPFKVNLQFIQLKWGKAE